MSKMSISEHANLAACLKRALLEAPLPLGNPFGENIYSKSALKVLLMRQELENIIFQEDLSKNIFCQNFGFFENDNLLKRCPITTTAAPPSPVDSSILSERGESRRVFGTCALPRARTEPGLVVVYSPVGSVGRPIN